MTSQSRRRVLIAGVTGVAVALAGCGGADDGGDGESESPPPEGEEDGGVNESEESEIGYGSPREEVDSYLTQNNARGYEGEIVDRTGESSATVSVGAGDGLAFDPPAFHIDTGTTVIWEWTGEGGRHNIVSSEDSDITAFGEEDIIDQAGATVEDIFEDEGVALYHCEPHREQGMIGAFIVGSIEGGNGGATGNETEDGQTTENQTDGSQTY